MKKVDILQTTLLVLAIMNAYVAMEYFLSMLAEIPKASSLYSGGFGEVITLLIITIALAAAVYLLIRYSRRIAEWLLKIDPEGDTEDTASLDLDRRTILFVLCVGIGLYVLIQASAYAIDDAYDLFKNKVTGTSALLAKRNYLVLELLRVTLGALLIYAAPNLTDFIEKKIAVRLKSQTPADPTDLPEPPPDLPAAPTDTQTS
jgi:hypothetical protein